MRNILLLLHRWLGLLIGLFFGFLMLTGLILTAIEQTEERWIINEDWIEKEISELGQDLDFLLREQPNYLYGTVYMPTPLQPAYGIPSPVYTSEEASQLLGGIQDRVRSPVTDYYTLDDFELIWSFDRTQESALFRFISDIHISLVDGTYLTAYIGYAGTLLCFIGLYLWWPWRRGFRWRNAVWPSQFKRTALVANHTSGSIIALVFLVILGFTGAVLNQRAPVLEIAEGIEAEKSEVTKVPQLSSRGEEWLSWLELLEIAHARLPGATLASISIPRDSEVLDFRFRTEADLSQFGASHVYLNPYTGVVEGAYDVRDTSSLRWLFSQFRPIHTGENMSGWYVVLIVLGSLVGTVVVTTGVMAFTRRLLAKSTD